MQSYFIHIIPIAWDSGDTCHQNHYFSSLTRDLAKYIFHQNQVFGQNFSINQNFWLCATFWSCAASTWSVKYLFSLISSLNWTFTTFLTSHCTYIPIKFRLIQIFFELIIIVYIIYQIPLKHHISSFSNISPKIMENFPSPIIQGISPLNSC